MAVRPVLAAASKAAEDKEEVQDAVRPTVTKENTMQQQKQQSPMLSPDGFRSFVGMIVFIARSLAVSGEVFLHRTDSFGERCFGMQIGGALLIIFLFPMFCEGLDPRPVFGFLVAFMAAVVVCRVRIAQRVRRGGPQEHTYYTGTPRLMTLFRRANEQSVKCIGEPMLMFLISAFTMPASQALGRYLWFVALGMLISNNLTVGYERRRAMDLNDAYIDQRNATERFRRMRGD
jgi:hypothetical protein